MQLSNVYDTTIPEVPSPQMNVAYIPLLKLCCVHVAARPIPGRGRVAVAQFPQVLGDDGVGVERCQQLDGSTHADAHHLGRRWGHRTNLLEKADHGWPALNPWLDLEAHDSVTHSGLGLAGRVDDLHPASQGQDVQFLSSTYALQMSSTIHQFNQKKARH